MAIRDAERCAELAKLASFVALHIVSSILCPSIVATQRGNFRKLACELYDPTAWQISAGLRAHGRDRKHVYRITQRPIQAHCKLVTLFCMR